MPRLFSSRRHLLIAVTILAIGIGLILPSREPAHQGRTYSSWLGQVCLATNATQRTEPLAALKSMGAPAVPHLLKTLRMEDSVFNRSWQKLYLKLPRGLWKWIRPPLYPEWKQTAAYYALLDNGAARDFLPEIFALLNHTNIFVRGAAGNLVSNIVQTNDVVYLPKLIENLRSDFFSVRRQMPYILIRFGPAASAAVPELTRQLQDTNALLQIGAAYALACIDSNLVPRAGSVLAQHLSDTNLFISSEAATSYLNAIDSSGSQAIEVLLPFTQSLKPTATTVPSTQGQIATSFLVSIAARDTNAYQQLVRIREAHPTTAIQEAAADVLRAFAESSSSNQDHATKRQ